MRASPITDEQALFIRLAFRPGITTTAQVARAYGQPELRIRRIVQGVTFKHVPGDVYPAGSPHERLPDEVILTIRREARRGVPEDTLAARFNRTQVAIWRIVRGLTYKHLGEALNPEERHPGGRGRFTDAEVFRIRRQYETRRYTIRQLAREHKIPHTCMDDLLFGKTYKHVGNICSRGIVPLKVFTNPLAREPFKSVAKAALAEAVAHCGSQRRLAEAIGVHNTQPYKWVKRGYLPEAYVDCVAQLTGIPPHRLRPDLHSAPVIAFREAA